MPFKSNSPFDGPLAPKIGFNNSIRNPIPGGQNPNMGQNQNSGGSKFNIGKMVPFGAIALALLVLPLTISQLNQSQDNRQRAAEITRFPTQVIPSPTPFATPTVIPNTTATPEASITPQLVPNN